MKLRIETSLNNISRSLTNSLIVYRKDSSQISQTNNKDNNDNSPVISHSNNNLDISNLADPHESSNNNSYNTSNANIINIPLNPNNNKPQTPHPIIHVYSNTNINNNNPHRISFPTIRNSAKTHKTDTTNNNNKHHEEENSLEELINKTNNHLNNHIPKRNSAQNQSLKKCINKYSSKLNWHDLSGFENNFSSVPQVKVINTINITNNIINPCIINNVGVHSGNSNSNTSNNNSNFNSKKKLRLNIKPGSNSFGYVICDICEKFINREQIMETKCSHCFCAYCLKGFYACKFKREDFRMKCAVFFCNSILPRVTIEKVLEQYIDQEYDKYKEKVLGRRVLCENFIGVMNGVIIRKNKEAFDCIVGCMAFDDVVIINVIDFNRSYNIIINTTSYKIIFFNLQQRRYML